MDEKAVAFAGPAGPIVAVLPEEVDALLRPLLAGWPAVEARGAPVLRVARVAGGYGASLDGAAPDPYGTAEAAANAVAGLLIGAALGQAPSRACLHASAAAAKDGLVVFIGASHAGKSSLALHAASQGARFFGDDRLIVGGGGTSLGLTSKLRLPLPEDAGARFADFAERRFARRVQGQVWLALGAGEAAAFGETRPIAALVIAEREEGAALSLEPAPPAAVVDIAVRQGFAPRLGAAGLVRFAKALSAEAPGFRLRFSRSVDAAAHVLARFGGPAR